MKIDFTGLNDNLKKICSKKKIKGRPEFNLSTDDIEGCRTKSRPKQINKNANAVTFGDIGNSVLGKISNEIVDNGYKPNKN